MSVDPVIYQTEPRTLTPREVTLVEIQSIATKHEVTLSEIFGKSRRRKIICARNEAIRYVWNKYHPRWSSVEIGRFFGKDHSTILYAAGRLSQRRPAEWVLTRDKTAPAPENESALGLVD